MESKIFLVLFLHLSLFFALKIVVVRNFQYAAIPAKMYENIYYLRYRHIIYIHFYLFFFERKKSFDFIAFFIPCIEIFFTEPTMQAACSKQIEFSNTLYSWWLFCYWRKSYISHGNLYPCHLYAVCLVLKAIGCSSMADAWSSSALRYTWFLVNSHTRAFTDREIYMPWRSYDLRMIHKVAKLRLFHWHITFCIASA